MSIYATLGTIRLPIDGFGDCDDDYIEVCLQGVPGHIGHPRDYPDGDPYAAFLPPVVDDPDQLRAVVFIDDKSEPKIGQQYINPVLVLSGAEYATLPWPDLWERLEAALQDRWYERKTCPACGAAWQYWRTMRNVYCDCGALQAFTADDADGSKTYLA